MQSHVEFEQSLFEAFPPSPPPCADSMSERSWLMREAKSLFSDVTWPEVVGHRLTYGEMDISLSIWMECFPAQVFDYYVASHLMFASLLLGNPEEVNYVTDVADAFLLPPAPDSDITVAEIDDALGPDATVASYGRVRLEFYERITPAQRSCIGKFLELYLTYRGAGFTQQGVRIFERNRDYWLNSLR